MTVTHLEWVSETTKQSFGILRTLYIAFCSDFGSDTCSRTVTSAGAGELIIRT